MIVRAISLSRSVQGWLERGPSSGRVLAVFERACDLLADDGEVVGVVSSEVGDGPLNIVVEGQGAWFGGLPSEAEVEFSAQSLCIGRVQIDLLAAAVWEPVPDWDRLGRSRAAILRRLPLVWRLAEREAPSGSFVALLAPRSDAECWQQRVLDAAYGALPALRQGWGGDVRRLEKAVVRLAGLGGGLTPSGDDLLSGLMLRAWLEHPTPQEFCTIVSRAAAPRTTTLSAAFLRRAARGECSAVWHRLLDALVDADDAGLFAAVRSVLSSGATSGADALAGFLLPSLWVDQGGEGG